MQMAVRPEAGRGDAGHRPSVRATHIAAVFDQAGLRVGLLPEVLEVELFQFDEKGIIFRRKRGWRRQPGWSRVLLFLASRKGDNTGPGQAGSRGTEYLF